MVAAAAALMIQKEPRLTPDTVKARLMKTASKAFAPQSIACDPAVGACFPIQNDVFTVGAGYLDVWAALNSTDCLAGPALSPFVRYEAASGKVIMVDPLSADPSLATAYSAIWGSSAIWGASGIWGSSAIWGSTVFIDGASAVWGSSALWGSSAVWGTSSTAGFSALWGSSVPSSPVATAEAESIRRMVYGDAN
jgi:serine protease AprX